MKRYGRRNPDKRSLSLLDFSVFWTHIDTVSLRKIPLSQLRIKQFLTGAVFPVRISHGSPSPAVIQCSKSSGERWSLWQSLHSFSCSSIPLLSCHLLCINLVLHVDVDRDRFCCVACLNRDSKIILHPLSVLLTTLIDFGKDISKRRLLRTLRDQ